MPKRNAPADEVVITDIEQLKAISDPLRLKLLEVTSQDPARPWSAKELAERLGTKQTKLYHHINLLEERGFLRVAETRMVSGIQERRYAATARSYRLERGLLGRGSEGPAVASEVLDVVFNKARTEIVDAVRGGLIDLDDKDQARSLALWAGGARLSRESARRVTRMIEKLAAMDEQDDPDGTEYGILVGFYPRLSGRDKDR